MASHLILRPGRPLAALCRPLAVPRITAVQMRNASTDTVASTSFSSLPPTAPRRPRVRTTFLGLTLLGVVVTGIGLYTYYNTFSVWPEEVRGDLRTALKAHKRGDNRRAEAAYTK